MELKDTNCLVTGASRGIGREIAIHLADEGANIAVNFRESQGEANQLVKFLQDKKGVNAVAVKADVSDPEQAVELVRHAADYLGGLDIVVNNAGILYHGPFEQTGVESIRSMVDTNLTGLMCVAHEAVPIMKKQGSGVIINISSGAGKSGIPSLAAYCATKFGVLGFNEALGKELNGTGVRTHAICPGMVDTDMTKDFDAEPEEMIKPEKIARYAVALITEKKPCENGGDVEVYW